MLVKGFWGGRVGVRTKEFVAWGGEVGGVGVEVVFSTVLYPDEVEGGGGVVAWLGTRG